MVYVSNKTALLLHGNPTVVYLSHKMAILLCGFVYVPIYITNYPFSDKLTLRISLVKRVYDDELLLKIVHIRIGIPKHISVQKISHNIVGMYVWV